MLHQGIDERPYLGREAPVAWKQHVVLVARRKPSAKIGAHQLPRGEVVGANDLRDPPDAGTCDHRRPFVRRD
jgi:hypothetical protein